MAEDPPTEPIFVALASVLAAIETGTIAEAEVESRVQTAEDQEVMLTVTVRKEIRPMLAPTDDA